MPLTDADAQVIMKTQIILPAPWGQASLADTVAGSRAREESNFLLLTALTQAVAALEAKVGTVTPAPVATPAPVTVAPISDADIARIVKAVLDAEAARLAN